MTQIYLPKLLYYKEKFCTDMAVLVEDGIINKIENATTLCENNPKAEKIYWTNHVLMPGTVNVHNHSFQSLLRGLAVDKPFLTWRDEALYRFSPLLQEEDLYAGAVFAFSEMMKNGVTTVCDFFYVHNQGTLGDEAIIKAAKDVGIRLVLARTMYDWEGAPSGYVESVELASKNVESLMEKYNKLPEQMTTVVPAPHSLHAASPEMVKAGYNLAKKFNTRYHIHVAEEMFEVEEVSAEFGKRPVEFLKELGVLDESMAAVHCVWLSDEEKTLMSQAKANLCYCPSSNMFLADGVTDLPTLYKNGVTVGLANDGACSNNRISVFEEMRMAALLQKVSNLDALCISAKDVFEMGTKGGAKLLQLPVGTIEKGLKADFVALNLQDISLQPVYSNYEQLLNNIVYAMQPTAIDKVVVNGKITVNNGELLNITQEQVIEKVNKVMVKFESFN